MTQTSELVPKRLARWRSIARRCLAADLEPDHLVWGDNGSATLLFDAVIPEARIPSAHRVSGRFVSLMKSVACHREPERWAFLYRMLWRLTHGEPHLVQVATDPLVHRLTQMHRAVRRASHKMKAFVRFRAVPDTGDDPDYVAWFEPAHRVVERTAPFFMERFRSMRWSILTPDGCARWNGQRLRLSPGLARHQAPTTADALEDLWRTYYAATFNPARLNRAMMQTEMPARYWKNLPEASLIAPLSWDAPGRVQRMLEQIFASPAALPAELEADESAVVMPVVRDTSWHPVHDPGWRVARERADAVLERRPVAVELDGSDLFTGVAGWTDSTLLAPGVFYPSDATSAEARLRFYATQLPLVEVDATYYSLPSAQTSGLWVRRTPEHFLFDVKAHALMTGHPTNPSRLPDWLREELPPGLRSARSVYQRHFSAEAMEEVWKQYLAALAPLRDAGKLSALMFQFPRWFTPSRKSASQLRRIRERLGDWPASVELRHRDWLCARVRDRTFGLLRDLGFSYVAVDAPQGMESSLPPDMAVTNPELAIIRLHGRRESTWEARNTVVTERYRYLYDKKELEAWLWIIRRTAEIARRIHILFNNNHANYAIVNAIEMHDMVYDNRTRDLAAPEVADGDHRWVELANGSETRGQE